jgi:hypothetical protein
VLWSKIGQERAIAIAGSKGFTTLEMTLETLRKTDGFDFVGTYNRWILPFTERFAAEAWKKLGSPIWVALSRKYAALLEGEVRVFVDHPKLLADSLKPAAPLALKKGDLLSKSPEALARVKATSKALEGHGAVLYDELMSITDAMESNTRITKVVIHDVSAGTIVDHLDRDVVLKRSKVFH